MAKRSGPLQWIGGGVVVVGLFVAKVLLKTGLKVGAVAAAGAVADLPSGFGCYDIIDHEAFYSESNNPESGTQQKTIQAKVKSNCAKDGNKVVVDVRLHNGGDVVTIVPMEVGYLSAGSETEVQTFIQSDFTSYEFVAVRDTGEAK